MFGREDAYVAPPPACEGCGGPITLTNGQSCVVTETLSIDGERLVQHGSTGWCGRCVADWDELMGFGT